MTTPPPPDTPEPGDRPPPPQREPSTIAIIATAFAGLGYALSARALLFFALLGAFAMGTMAMLRGDVLSIVCLGLYGALTVLPMAALEFVRRER